MFPFRSENQRVANVVEKTRSESANWRHQLAGSRCGPAPLLALAAAGRTRDHKLAAESATDVPDSSRLRIVTRAGQAVASYEEAHHEEKQANLLVDIVPRDYRRTELRRYTTITKLAKAAASADRTLPEIQRHASTHGNVLCV